MSTEWGTLSVRPDFSSDASYYDAVQQQRQTKQLSFSLHGEIQEESPRYVYPSTTSTSPNTFSPKRRPVTSLSSTDTVYNYERTVPVNVSQATAPKENQCAKYFNITMHALKWALWNAAWPTLKWCGGQFWKLGLFIKETAFDRKPQPLTLPGEIDETHPGWDVQAKQLAFEVAQLKASFLAIQSQKPNYPLKFALQITFRDGSGTQTVLSTLLIQTQKELRNLTTFADKLYPQIVQVRKELEVSAEYSMQVAFVALHKDPSEDGPFFIYQRSNQYVNGTKPADISSEVRTTECRSEAVSEVIGDIGGIETAKSWLESLENWNATGKVLAIYQKGEEEPLPLLVEP